MQPSGPNDFSTILVNRNRTQHSPGSSQIQKRGVFLQIGPCAGLLQKLPEQSRQIDVLFVL